jgi:hypothetical protein
LRDLRASFDTYIAELESGSTAPEPEPTPEPEPAPESEAHAPLSWDALIFKNAKPEVAVISVADKTIEDVSITNYNPNPACLVIENVGARYPANNKNAIIRRARIRGCEGMRMTTGNVLLEDAYIEISKQVAPMHADGIQCYGGPNDDATLTLRRVCVRFLSNNDATAGLFSANGWKGTFDIDSCVFWGGPHGIRINADGGKDIKVRNTFFIKDSFAKNFVGFQNWPAGGYPNPVPCTEWSNNRWATVNNGVLVPGEEIPPPHNYVG